jgi:hypothetical protein
LAFIFFVIATDSSSCAMTLLHPDCLLLSTMFGLHRHNFPLSHVSPTVVSLFLGHSARFCQFLMASLGLICPNRKIGPKFTVRAIPPPSIFPTKNRFARFPTQYNLLSILQNKFDEAHDCCSIGYEIACQLRTPTFEERNSGSPLLAFMGHLGMFMCFSVVFCSSDLFEPNRQHLDTHFQTSSTLCTCGGLSDEADTHFQYERVALVVVTCVRGQT